MLSLLTDKLKKYSIESNLQLEDTSFLLSFSGGIDSTVLTSLMIELKCKFAFKLYLIHFNHNAHAQANQIEQSCKLFALDNNVEFYCKNLSIDNKSNFEASAREIRYFELENYAKILIFT